MSLSAARRSKTSRGLRPAPRKRRLAAVQELVLGGEPVVSIVTVLTASGEKELVCAIRDRVTDGIALGQGIGASTVMHTFFGIDARHENQALETAATRRDGAT